MARFDTVTCQCEHESHFDTLKHTPNGNPAHKYGRKLYEHATVEIVTDYGTFRVCKDCAEDCHGMEGET